MIIYPHTNIQQKPSFIPLDEVGNIGQMVHQFSIIKHVYSQTIDL